MTHTNQAEKIEQSLRKLVDSIATARQGEGATLPSGLSARQWALIDEAAQSLVAAVAIARQEFSGTPHYGPDPQIDRRCAALLGWHRGTGGFESPSYWYNQRGQEMGFAITDPFANMRAWSPTTQPQDVAHLEDEIERRGFQVPYLRTLVNLIAAEGVLFSSWRLLRARPELRARAFIAAMEQ